MGSDYKVSESIAERVAPLSRALLLLILILPLSPHLLAGDRNPTLTRDQAIDAIRSSSEAQPSAAYKVLREFSPSAQGARLAKLAVKKARTARKDFFAQGAVLGLLRDGGYLIVEYDPRIDLALNLVVVTRDENGRPLVDTEKIDIDEREGHMTLHDIEEVVDRTQDFMTKLFRSHTPQLVNLVKETFGDVPTFSGDESPTEIDPPRFFVLPTKLVALGDPKDIRTLSVVFWNIELWPFLHAMSLPEFPAHPLATIGLAYDQRDKLMREFRATKRKSLRSFYSTVGDFGSINNQTKLKRQLRALKELNEYLEARAVPSSSRWIFDLKCLTFNHSTSGRWDRE